MKIYRLKTDSGTPSVRLGRIKSGLHYIKEKAWILILLSVLFLQIWMKKSYLQKVILVVM